MDGPVNIEKKYRIGELDQRVQVLVPTEAQSTTTGEVTVTWGNYGTFWSAVQPLGGGESIISDMLMPAHRARFVFRYDSTITEKCRLVWALKTYDIKSIEVVPRNRFLIIIAESNDTQTGTATSYGDYLTTNSLRVRYATGAMVGNTPTEAEVTTAIGLTPAIAGAGYICLLTTTKAAPLVIFNGIIISNGTNWLHERLENT